MQTQRPTRAAPLASLALATLLQTPAPAQSGSPDIAWIVPADGAFQAGANWDGGSPPGPTQNARFALPLAHTVVFLNNAANAALRLDGDANTTLNLAGRSYALGAPTSISIAELPNASTSLHIRNGAVASQNIHVGAVEGSTGALLISAAALTASQDLFLPRAEHASATLGIAEGASLSARTIYLGFDDGSHGAALVHGPGSTLAASLDLIVGQFGDATLETLGGARSSCQNFAVGRAATSTGHARVAGVGSELFTIFKLSVGSGFGAGASLEIADGAAARSLFGVVAEFQSSAAHVAIRGAGSLWDVEDALYIGYRSSGSLSVEQGARLESRFAVLGRYSGGAGHVRVMHAGSRWHNEQRIDVGVPPGGASSLYVDRDASVHSATVHIGPLGTLAGEGAIEARVLNAGVHRPGPDASNGAAAAPGVGVVLGDYAILSGGALEIDLQGETPGVEHDLLAVAGAITLGGELRVFAPAGFDPPLGAAFRIAVANSIDGRFHRIALPELPWPRRLTVEQGPDFLELRCALRSPTELMDLLAPTEPARGPLAAKQSP
ncbi:MAG: hypothetical protein IBJ10_06470 [Phycisphaerales bacterium]|nr:hypothetical protein [Phycisphaerales bacterium]